MKLRTLFALLTAGAMILLAGCSSGGSSTDGEEKATTVRIGTFGQSLTSILEVLAVEGGFLEEEGLKGELLPFPSGAEMYPALLGGSLDYVPLSFDPGWGLVQQGECFSWFMGEMGSQYDIIAKPGVKLADDGGSANSFRKLKGLRVGVTSLGGPLHSWFLLLEKQAGLNPGDITFIATGGMATGVTAFKEDQVDATASWAGWAEKLDEFEVIVNLHSGDDNPLAKLIQSGSAVTCDYKKKNPEVVESICTAMHAAFDFATDPKNTSEMGALVADVLGVSKEAADTIWEEFSGSFVSPDLTKERWNDQAPYVNTKDNFIPDYDKYVMKSCDA